jgi:hypothetical protein
MSSQFWMTDFFKKIGQYRSLRNIFNFEQRARARSWWITAELLAGVPLVVIFAVYRGE